MSVVYLNSKDKVLDYRLDKLPSKLKVWHTYVANVIKVLYQKTPMLTISSPMESPNEFVKYQFDMFFNYSCMQELLMNLFDIQRGHFMNSNEATLKQKLMELLNGKYLDLIQKSSYELHFVPTSQPSNQISLSYSFLPQGNNPATQLKLKQKNIESLQEMEFLINPEEDFGDLPEDMQLYVNHFFKSIE